MKSESEVIIYKTSWCAFCHTEAQWLDSLGVKYIAKDIEADQAAYDELTKKTGGQSGGVPVTDIAGEIIFGFDRPKLTQALQKNNLIK